VSEQLDHTMLQQYATELVQFTPPDLLEWFDQQGMCRTLITADLDGSITTLIAPPVLLLGKGDAMVRTCPHPLDMAYFKKSLSDMSLDDYHIFLLQWFMKAVDASTCHCIVCDKPVNNTNPNEPWDGIYVDKELVCWLILHFDCKKYLAREFKGRTPFELHPTAPTTYDLSKD